MKKQYNIDLLLRSITLVDLLTHFGKRVDHVGYMYYSPFRDEDSPSMRIRTRDGVDIWVDYGADLTDEDREHGRKFHGGGLIDMAMELGGYSRRDAIEFLAEMRPGLSLAAEVNSRQEYTKKPSGRSSDGNIVIEDISARFTNRHLIDYAEKERCIPLSVLSTYCRQVRYHSVRNACRAYLKIGFPNNEGGWTLRGSKGKISSRSGISTFNTEGVLTQAPSSRRAFVFEGFFDFLSWIAWNGGGYPKTDACILNSVSNLDRAIPWLSQHSEIAVCFDNDPAGRKAFEHLKEACSGADVRDSSGLYAGFNDLNDFYVHRCRAREEEAKGVESEPPSNQVKMKR